MPVRAPRRRVRFGRRFVDPPEVHHPDHVAVGPNFAAYGFIDASVPRMGCVVESVFVGTPLLEPANGQGTWVLFFDNMPTGTRLFSFRALDSGGAEIPEIPPTDVIVTVV
jgi:hypothetical protein